jgi:hypothetical protein
MIIKGKSRAGPTGLAAHLGNAEKNERVQLLETRGTIATDLRGALVEMDAVAAGTRCQRSLYHAALSPEPPHRLTPDQRMRAVDALEKKLGLDGHARVVVIHEKHGREHVHVVWSRINIHTMHAVSDSHNYRKHEECSRDLEREFGHGRVQGAHHEREGVARPNRTPSRAELRQEERTGVKGREVRDHVSEAFRQSDGPEAFQSALKIRGYQLALGDRRDFVVIDPAGGIHSLARRIEDMKAADLRAYMASVDREALPTVEQAVALARLARDARDETRLEKAHSQSGGYVAQSSAAQKEFERRQKKLDQGSRGDDLWERIEAGEARRIQAEQARVATKEERAQAGRGKKQSDGNANLEDFSDSKREVADPRRSDEAQARIDRLLGPDRSDDPGRQGPAPGGGRTRSR